MLHFILCYIEWIFEPVGTNHPLHSDSFCQCMSLTMMRVIINEAFVKVCLGWQAWHLCTCLYWSPWPLFVLWLLTLILSVSMWRLISQIAASQRGAQLSPSRDVWPAHTNLHTELNLHIHRLFSPLWGCWEACTHVYTACVPHVNFFFFWHALMLELCKLKLKPNLKPHVYTGLIWIRL